MKQNLLESNKIFEFDSSETGSNLFRHLWAFVHRLVFGKAPKLTPAHGFLQAPFPIEEEKITGPLTTTKKPTNL